MEDSTSYSLLISLFIFLSAVLSCAETSVTASSRARIHRLSNDGNKRAKILEQLLTQRERVIGTILALNNAVNILASAVATGFLIKVFGEAGLLYATIGMTLMILIFAEILPKTIAFKDPENMALRLAPFMFIAVKIFLPFTEIAHRIVNFVIDPFFGNLTKTKALEIAEIRDAVDLKTKEGYLVQYDKDLIDGVLDLSDTDISEIMVHRKDIKSINIDLPIIEIINKALDLGHTRIPLWKDNQDNIVAIFNVKKMLHFLHLNKGSYEKFNLKEVTSEPWFVPSSNSLRNQLFAFRKRRKRFALVVDEYGSLLGLLTLEDILEEIVGDIEDIDDKNDTNIIKIKSGSYKITGRALIRDINKKLNWNIKEDEDAYNLAAFIINNLGRIPEEKEHFIIDDYHFKILKKRSGDLLLVKVKKDV
jgi:Mg2+/Co2+ transporter CorB